MPSTPAHSPGPAAAVHARLFHAAFTRAADVAGELQSLLPPEIASKLDLDTLQLLPGSFLEPPLAAQAADLLYAVQLSGREALVYLLFQHAGPPEAALPLPLLGCLVRLWERRLRERPTAPLPLVLPLLVYQGERRWRGPRSLYQLFQVDLPTWVAAAPLIPDFEFLVDDLAGTGALALQARVRLSPFARLALFLLQRARRSPDLVPELAAWADLLSALAYEPGGPENLALLVDYMFSASAVSPRRLGWLLRVRVGPLAEHIMMTTAEKLLAQGRAEGERQGRARGEAEGRAATLLALLGARFGALEPEQQQRIRAASNAQLERWTERVLQVAAPAELFT